MGLRWFLSVLVLASAAALPLSAADITDITVEVTTDRDFFEPGEEVTIIATQCNPTDESITHRFGCSSCHDFYFLLNEQGETVAECGGGGILVVVDETWMPGECKERELVWDQLAPYCGLGGQVPDGIYQARHEFVFNQLDYSLVTLGPTFVIGSSLKVPTLSSYGLAAMTVSLILVAIFRMPRVSRRTGRST